MFTILQPPPNPRGSRQVHGSCLANALSAQAPISWLLPVPTSPSLPHSPDKNINLNPSPKNVGCDLLHIAQGP